MQNNRLSEEVNRLLAEGTSVLATSKDRGHRGDVVEATSFAKWLMGCRNLIRVLEKYADPWKDPFEQSHEYYDGFRARTMYATLQAISEAINHGMLVDIESIVVAATFDSLLEQAEYLASEGYFLAAGVLGRAVLEEHLREWCASANCAPPKDRPTLSDFNASLYRSKQYNVSVMKHVESMSAVGNDAAHNNPDLQSDDVNRLLRDTREFLGKFSPT